MTRNAALRLAAARNVDASELVLAREPPLRRHPVGQAHHRARREHEGHPKRTRSSFSSSTSCRRSGMLRLDATHLAELGEGYTSALSLFRRARPAHSAFTCSRPRARRSTSRSVPRVRSDRAGAPRNDFAAFFRLGLEHILEGYDHLLFLAGLLIASRSLGSASLLVSVFTVSHSVTARALGARVGSEHRPPSSKRSSRPRSSSSGSRTCGLRRRPPSRGAGLRLRSGPRARLCGSAAGSSAWRRSPALS